jgi:hypothetical protein
MIVQISDELFWGFKVNFDETQYKSFNELAFFVKKELILFLRINNLLNLQEIAEKINLHNHEFKSYEEMIKSNKNIIYLCGGCKAMV